MWIKNHGEGYTITLKAMSITRYKQIDKESHGESLLPKSRRYMTFLHVDKFLLFLFIINNCFYKYKEIVNIICDISIIIGKIRSHFRKEFELIRITNTRVDVY